MATRNAKTSGVNPQVWARKPEAGSRGARPARWMGNRANRMTRLPASGFLGMNGVVAPASFFLALLFLLFWLLAPARGYAQGSAPTDDDVNRVARQLYCPVCESTPLDVCP